LVGFEEHKAEIAALGATVIAASVDEEDKAREIAETVSFPIGFGVTRTDAQTIGAWWSTEREIIQPAEFILRTDGKVVSSTYSSGPIGRVDAADVVRLLTFYEKKKSKT
jgi:peroxiredoxin